MTALVTGAGGFLGTALVRRLLERGERELRLFVRPGPKRGKLEALAADFPGARVDFVVGSLTSPADCARAVDGVDLVYHLAAGLSGAAAELILHSVVATKHLCAAITARPRPARLVHVSSFSVYGVAGLGRGSLVDEQTPIDAHPERRDLYALSKIRQEQLLWDVREKTGLPLTVLRPGVIYGPGGSAISARVGLNLFGVFLALGGRNRLPLAYVDNTAEALAVAARHGGDGEVYNVVDDDLPTCRDYLRAYQRALGRMRVIPMPYPATMAMSLAVERYHRWSRGQLPAVFTPYKTQSTWGGNRFTNEKLKSIGWRPIVSTAEGMQRLFASLRAAESSGRAA